MNKNMENNIITAEEIHAKLDVYSDKLMSIIKPVNTHQVVNKSHSLKKLGFKNAKVKGLIDEDEILNNYLNYLNYLSGHFIGYDSV